VNMLDEVDRRLSMLSLLAEDVNVKVQNLKKEEVVINKAGEQITELKFLLAEVENKRNNIN
jgi:hypothetical protein